MCVSFHVLNIIPIVLYCAIFYSQLFVFPVNMRHQTAALQYKSNPMVLSLLSICVEAHLTISCLFTLIFFQWTTLCNLIFRWYIFLHLHPSFVEAEREREQFNYKELASYLVGRCLTMISPWTSILSYILPTHCLLLKYGSNYLYFIQPHFLMFKIDIWSTE